MKARKQAIGRDAGVPDRGHQTMDLQGALGNLSRGHLAHDMLHRRRGRPLPDIHFPSIKGKKLGRPQGGGPR